MKIIKLVIFYLFVCLSQTFLEAMDQNPKKFKTKKTVQPKNIKKKPISTLGALSLKSIKENIKYYDAASRARLADDIEFQMICLQNLDVCWEIYIQALNIPKATEKYLKNVTLEQLIQFNNEKKLDKFILDKLAQRYKKQRYLKDLTWEKVLKLYKDKTLDRYIRLNRKIKLLEKKYKEKMKYFEEEGYSTEEDIGPVISRLEANKQSLEKEIDQLLR